MSLRERRTTETSTSFKSKNGWEYAVDVVMQGSLSEQLVPTLFLSLYRSSSSLSGAAPTTRASKKPTRPPHHHDPRPKKKKQEDDDDDDDDDDYDQDRDATALSPSQMPAREVGIIHGVEDEEEGSPPPCQNDDDGARCSSSRPVLVSYALTGLADGIGRAAADQRFKLHTVRAVFAGSASASPRPTADPSTSGSSFAWLWPGLPCLFAVWRQQGVGQVTLVSPSPCCDDDEEEEHSTTRAADREPTLSRLERLVSFLQGPRAFTHPTVHFCQVPPPRRRRGGPDRPPGEDPSLPEQGHGTWWKVYEDEHILVHGYPLEWRRSSSSSPPTPVHPVLHGGESALTSTLDRADVVVLVVYVHTLKQVLFHPLGASGNSLLVLPPMPEPVIFSGQDDGLLDGSNQNGIGDVEFVYRQKEVQHMLQNLPIVEVVTSRSAFNSHRANVQEYTVSIMAGLVLDRIWWPLLQGAARRMVDVWSPDMEWFSVPRSVPQPDRSGDDRGDDGLWVRAQQQAQIWHGTYPRLFPWSCCQAPCCCSNSFVEKKKKGDRLDDARHDPSTQKQEPGHQPQLPSRVLYTGASLLLTEVPNHNMRSASKQCMILNRLEAWQSSPPQTSEMAEQAQQWRERLDSFLQGRRLGPPTAESTTTRQEFDDDNQIDLDDEDDDHGEPDVSSTTVLNEFSGKHTGNLVGHLLVLGTGCAAPSPYRGASGYAIILANLADRPCPGTTWPGSTPPPPPSSANNKDELVLVLEAGEGFVTQWHRHSQGRSLAHIRIIWISHAHWDHYGGLVNLLLNIRRCQRQDDYRTGLNQREQSPANGPDLKRARIELDEARRPPWVLAPMKVLRYLDCLLEKGECERYFRAAPHDQPRLLPEVWASFPMIQFWDNVQVQHSCAQAYGVVFGVRSGPTKSTPGYTFCFSGDTRPCDHLIEACRHWCKNWARSPDAAQRGPSLDFLLHEATFDQDEWAMAQSKRHSTVGEALEVGQQVGARRILLTHFSQRYQRRPRNDTEMIMAGQDPHVGFALDGMLIPLYASWSECRVEGPGLLVEDKKSL